MRTTRHRIIARNLAARFLARTWSPTTMRLQLRAALGPTTRKAQNRLLSEILAACDAAYPPSPALANLVAWRLDVRLAGLARSFGAVYTRYADDMTFSGDAEFASKSASLVDAVATIVGDEGYRLNQRKTRVMTQASRQQVTGIVVNEHLNVPRASYDALKAILTNCRRNGLDAENRDGHADFRAHLAGRVGWVESLNPARGRRLRAILDTLPRQ